LRKVSDLRRAFWPALEVTGISDDLYRRTIEMSASAKCILVTGSLQECLRGCGV
jgi:hypothetical protein